MTSSGKFCDNCGASNQINALACFSCAQTFPQNPIVATQTQQTFSSLNDYLKNTSLFVQRYRVLKLLGQGGMGDVYQVEDLRFSGAKRAIKELSLSNLNSQEAQEAANAFQSEAIMLAKLLHPNLPRIYDHFSESGRWYLVMDYIEGETLEDRLTRLPDHQCSLENALQISLHLCDVLQHLHDQQPPIIFRDLKPANIMLTPENHLYLIDFGIARFFKPNQMKDTVALGSPGYAAPEQYGRTQTTPSADIYSLGAVLHQMISGHDPSADPFQFSPLQLAPSPENEEFANLVMQMVETRREKRPQTIIEVKSKLQALISTKSSPAIAVPTRKQPATLPKPLNSKMKVVASPALQQANRSISTKQKQRLSSAVPGHLRTSSRVGLLNPLPVTKKQRKIGCVVVILIAFLICVFTGSAVFQAISGQDMLNNPTNTSSSPLSNPVSPSTGKLLYQADWSSNSDNWNVVGQWKYDREKKMLISDGSQTNFIILAPYQPLLRNYAVEAEIQYSGNTSVSGSLSLNSFGIAFGIGIHGQGYVCDIVNGLGATVSSVEESGRADSITDYSDYRPGTSFHTYRIEVRGGTVFSFIDGKEFAQTTNASPLQTGSVGIRANKVILHVKSFKIFSL